MLRIDRQWVDEISAGVVIKVEDTRGPSVHWIGPVEEEIDRTIGSDARATGSWEQFFAP